MRHASTSPNSPLALLLLVAPLACGDAGSATTADDSDGATVGDATQGTDATTAGTQGSVSQSSVSQGSDTGDGTTGGSATTGVTETTTSPTTIGPTSTSSTTGATGTTAPITITDTDPDTTGGGCGPCDQPNQTCVDNVCVTSCQGQDPDPCGPDQVCDVISGECKDEGELCTVAGAYLECGPQKCGPGTFCDGQGGCIPVAPCGAVSCTDEGLCWGGDCSCVREHDCPEVPDVDLLNGSFSTDIFDLEFADDCTAWMVTLRSGTDYVRRLETDGTLTQWSGVANLNMGEIKVLKALTPLSLPTGGLDTLQSKPQPPEVEGIGEVAITYTCCPTCGCFVDPPQGVARLDEDNMQNPLPIIIVAMPSQGMGPFGNTAADAGPMGLTWGEDRVLYVGNSTQPGDLNSANLDQQSQEVLTPMPARIHAAASVSSVHLLVAIEGGELYRYNTETQESELLLDLMSDVTSLSFDAFSGIVYAGLQSLEVLAINPYTGELAAFDTMPSIGRVTVSPDGRLWFVPAKHVQQNSISFWDLPNEL